MHEAKEPYPFAILSDGLFILGIHQTHDFTAPYITSFAPDMAKRIAQFQAKGFSIKGFSAEDTGQFANGVLQAPGGQGIFLFEGQV